MSIKQATRAIAFQLQGSASAKVLWWVKPRDGKGTKGQRGYKGCVSSSQNTHGLWALGMVGSISKATGSHRMFERNSMLGFRVQP